MRYPALLTVLAGLAACQPTGDAPDGDPTAREAVRPAYVTDAVPHDSDDPAVWVDPNDPARSLIIGTDKDADGGLYVFNLQGKTQADKVVRGLKRPNNVDVEYGLRLGDTTVDVAVTAERLTSRLRIFRLPDMQPIDGGGIDIFAGEDIPGHRAPMGVAAYRHPTTGEVYAIVGRKEGPTDGTYLWQYRLTDAGGTVGAELVRKFGQFSGQKEIEAILVDDALGYVYCSDEGVGVRKYYADPARGNAELALFATEGVAEDHEGLSCYALTDSTGYLLLSDQQVDRFLVFPREGTATDPHAHPQVAAVPLSTRESDGSEAISAALGPDFPHGLFVAMSDDRTFQIYRWEDLAGEQLERRENARP